MLDKFFDIFVARSPYLYNCLRVAVCEILHMKVPKIPPVAWHIVNSFKLPAKVFSVAKRTERIQCCAWHMMNVHLNTNYL